MYIETSPSPPQSTFEEKLRGEALQELNAQLAARGLPELVRLPYPAECMRSHPRLCMFGTAVRGFCGYFPDDDQGSGRLVDASTEGSPYGVYVNGLARGEELRFGKDTAVARLSKAFDRGDLGGPPHEWVPLDDIEERLDKKPDLRIP